MVAVRRRDGGASNHVRLCHLSLQIEWRSLPVWAAGPRHDPARTPGKGPAGSFSPSSSADAEFAQGERGGPPEEWGRWDSGARNIEKRSASGRSAGRVLHSLQHGEL